MKAKELRATALSCLESSAKAREIYGLLNDCNSPELPSEALYRHILATVCEDDDEPIDEAWFKANNPKPLDPETDSGLLLWRTRVDVLFRGDRIEFPHIKTRGEFRALCRCLGVTLKEGT